MTISLVGTATASATTVTPPTHLAGDLIIIFAYRSGSTTAPALPSGWTNILTKSGTTCSGRLGYKIATATNDASGTWTNATELTCHVYRPSSNNTLGIGGSASSSSTTSTVNYPALTMVHADGTSWAAGFVGVNNTTQTIATAPTGMTNESSLTGASAAIAGHDTEGGVSSWSSTNVTTTGTAGDTVSVTVEILLLANANSTNTANIAQYVAGGGNPSSRGQSGNAYKMPLPNSTGAGNAIVLFITYDAGATVTITDNNSNSWSGTATVKASGGAGNLDSACYVLMNANSGLTTITCTFGASTTVFQYELFELYHVQTSGSIGSSSVAFSTTIGAGSFTPANNNSGGGNVVLAYFAKAATVPSHLTTRIFSDANSTLLSADIGWANANDSMTKAAEIYVQATSAAINPKVISEADSGDDWNSLAISIPVNNSAGTDPPSGIRIVGIHHFATEHFPASGPYFLQIPSLGNLRCIVGDDPSLHALTVTDSEGNTWTAAGSNPGVGIWYFPASAVNTNLVLDLSGGGSDITLSWRYCDIIGAATSPFDSSVASGQTVSSLTSFTASPAPSPSNTNGLVIANIGLGQGPGLAVTAPTGAVWDLCTYTGEVDTDLIENADIMAHYNNTASGSETWTFTITSVASNSTSGGFIAFVAAPTAAVIYVEDDVRTLRRRPWLAHLQANDIEGLPFVPPAATVEPWAFDERSRRVPRMALRRAQPQDEAFPFTSTVTPANFPDFDRDRPPRRIAIHLRTRPSDIEGLPFTPTSTIEPWAFDEDGRRVIRKNTAYSRPQPSDIEGLPFTETVTPSAWGDIEQGPFLRRLTRTRRTRPDEFLFNPTQFALAGWGFDEEAHRREYRLWRAYAQPNDIEGLQFTSTVTPTSYYEEEPHRLQRRPRWVARPLPADNEGLPFFLVSNTWADIDRDQIPKRRPWLAHPQPADNEGWQFTSVKTPTSWYDDPAIRRHPPLLIRRISEAELIVVPQPYLWLGVDQVNRRPTLAPRQSRIQADEFLLFKAPAPPPWGWEVATKRAVAGRLERRLVADEFFPFAPPPPPVFVWAEIDVSRRPKLLPVRIARIPADEFLPFVPPPPTTWGWEINARRRSIPVFISRTGQDEWLLFPIPTPPPPPPPPPPQPRPSIPDGNWTLALIPAAVGPPTIPLPPLQPYLNEVGFTIYFGGWNPQFPLVFSLEKPSGETVTLPISLIYDVSNQIYNPMGIPIYAYNSRPGDFNQVGVYKIRMRGDQAYVTVVVQGVN